MPFLQNHIMTIQWRHWSHRVKDKTLVECHWKWNKSSLRRHYKKPNTIIMPNVLQNVCIETKDVFWSSIASSVNPMSRQIREDGVLFVYLKNE